MNLQAMKGFTYKIFIVSSVLSLNLLSIQKPSHAIVPHVFNPNKEELKKASQQFGRTAAQLIHFNQTKEAIRVAKLAVILNPDDSRLWAILAEAQVRNNLTNEAIESLDKAKNINPNNANLWFAQGFLLLQKKEPQKAVNLIEKGLRINPKNANAYFQLGNARIMQFKNRLALQAFEKALSLKPSFWESLNNKGLVLFEMGKTNKAINVWEDVLKLTDNPEPMLALASALNQLNKGNIEALKLAKKALALNPNYISTEYQADQLWGQKLQKAAKELFAQPILSSEIEKAFENVE